MWLTCFFRDFQPQRNRFPRFAKVHFLCPERYLTSDHFYVGLCISQLFSGGQLSEVRITNGKSVTVPGVTCALRFAASESTPLFFSPCGTYFTLASSPSCILKRGAYCLCTLSIFRSPAGPFSQRKNAKSKINADISASLNERKKAETTISEPADKMAAT